MKQVGSQYATKEDLKILKSELKKEIKKEIKASEQMIRLDTRLAIDEAKIELETKITQFKDIILTAIDPLLKELEERRHDREISAHQAYEMRQQLDGHEKRLSKLEHS